MTATTPAAFDPAPKHIGSSFTVIAGGTILAGQLVCHADTGADWTVIAMDTAVIATTPVGIAAEGATTGDYFTVYGPGSIVKVCEGAGNDLDAGDWVVPSAAAGCVDVMDPAIGTHSATVTASYVGYCLEDIAKNSTGYIMFCPGPMETASS